MLSSFLAQQGLQRIMKPCSSCCCGGKARWKAARKRSPCRSDSHLCPLLDRERRKKFPAAGLRRAPLANPKSRSLRRARAGGRVSVQKKKNFSPAGEEGRGRCERVSVY